MNDTKLETLDQVRQFLEGTEASNFQIESNDARYHWIQHTLVRFHYLKLSKTNKGLITRYIRKITGYSLAQVKRRSISTVNTDEWSAYYEVTSNIPTFLILFF